MKLLPKLLTLLLLTSGLHAAFTEFYVQTTGSNLNAGSSTADAALVTATNGNWDGTSIFIATGADLSAVTVGMFASVYNDGATVGVYVARITIVDDTTDTITCSTTAKSGTAPTVSATGRSIKIGGAWKGPNAAEDHPFDFVEAGLTNSAGDAPRTNFKNGTNYAITAGVAHADVGPMRFEGYTTTAGDGGKATIDGGNPSASFNMLVLSGVNNGLVNLIFQNNGTTSGTSGGLDLSAGECFVKGCVVSGIRGIGIRVRTIASTLVECETYNCNKSNTAATGAFSIEAAGGTCIRCVAHDNTGSNTYGFQVGASAATLIDCIADTNAGKGFVFSGTAFLTMVGCEAYANTGDGLDLTTASAAAVYIENCNFIVNGGWGINSSGSALRTGKIQSCGFGAGTAANTSGQILTTASLQVAGTVTYASNVTPWVDPANGDFRINLATAKGTGRGTFTETAASYAGTIGYPDIGAAQHLETAGGQTSSASVK